MSGILLRNPFFFESESLLESPFKLPTTALAFSSASGAKFPIPDPIPDPAITPTGPQIAPKPPPARPPIIALVERAFSSDSEVSEFKVSSASARCVVACSTLPIRSFPFVN